MLITIHIAAGSIALLTGSVALLSRKGSRVHRRSGLLFVVTMLAMSVSALPMAVGAQKPTSVMGGTLTLYLVLTSWLAIRRPQRRLDWTAFGAALAALSIAYVFASLGVEGLRGGSGAINGLPPEPMFIFASIALLASIGDARWALLQTVSRRHRIGRHLWRMCVALLIAAVSFFLGQAQVLPEMLRNSILPAAIPLAVVVLMAFWILRVQLGARYRQDDR